MKYGVPMVGLALGVSLSLSSSAAIINQDEWGKADFYGSLRILLTNEKQRGLDVEDGVSRIGVKGHVNWTDAWQATYRLEGRVNLDEGEILADDSGFHRRITYIGLKSPSFGEFRAGKQLAPHYMYTLSAIDTTFHNPRHYNMRQHGNEGASVRNANSLSYWSPLMHGVQISMLAEADNADTESNGIDNFNIAGRYTVKNWQFGLSLLDQRSDLNVATGLADKTEDVKTLAALIQFKNARHKAVIRYQGENWASSEDFKTMGAYYGYSVSPGLVLQARSYWLERGNINGQQIMVGAIKKFATRGELFIDITLYDKGGAYLKGGGRNDDLTLGYKVNL